MSLPMAAHYDYIPSQLVCNPIALLCIHFGGKYIPQAYQLIFFPSDLTLYLCDVNILAPIDIAPLFRRLVLFSSPYSLHRVMPSSSYRCSHLRRLLNPIIPLSDLCPHHCGLGSVSLCGSRLTGKRRMSICPHPSHNKQIEMWLMSLRHRFNSAY